MCSELIAGADIHTYNMRTLIEDLRARFPGLVVTPAWRLSLKRSITEMLSNRGPTFAAGAGSSDIGQDGGHDVGLEGGGSGAAATSNGVQDGDCGVAGMLLCQGDTATSSGSVAYPQQDTLGVPPLLTAAIAVESKGQISRIPSGQVVMTLEEGSGSVEGITLGRMGGAVTARWTAMDGAVLGAATEAVEMDASVDEMVEAVLQDVVEELVAQGEDAAAEAEPGSAGHVSTVIGSAVGQGASSAPPTSPSVASDQAAAENLPSPASSVIDIISRIQAAPQAPMVVPAQSEAADAISHFTALPPPLIPPPVPAAPATVPRAPQPSGGGEADSGGGGQMFAAAFLVSCVPQVLSACWQLWRFLILQVGEGHITG